MFWVVGVVGFLKMEKISSPVDAPSRNLNFESDGLNLRRFYFIFDLENEKDEKYCVFSRPNCEVHQTFLKSDKNLESISKYSQHVFKKMENRQN